MKLVPVRATADQDVKHTANRDVRPWLSRAQVLTLVVGTLQIAVALVPVFPLGPADQALHLCTGLVGVLLAWKHEYARMYGIALLLVYGKLLVADMDASTVWLQLPTPETVAYGRGALAGLAIALVPAFTRR